MAASLPAPGSNRGLIALRVRVPGHDSAHARPRATSSLSRAPPGAPRARGITTRLACVPPPPRYLLALV